MRPINKNKFIFSTLIVLLIFVASFSFVDALARPRLVVSGFSVENGAAIVGQDFNLAINVTDVDEVCAMSTVLGITANAPFIARQTSNAMPVNICGGETKTIRLPLHVDPTATGGSYQIPVSMNFEDTLNTPYSSSDIITLFVSGTPSILAHVSSSNPVDVYPGDTATLSITLENAGTFEAQSLSATLSTPLGSALEVKGANSVATIGTLASRQTATVQYSVELPKNAIPQDYPLTVTISYLDENRNAQTRDVPLTFTAKKKALFTASDSATKMLYTGDNQKTVQILLKNTGTDTAYKLKVKPMPQFPFTTDGSVRYIESLAPGQQVPVDVVFNVDKDGTVGQYGLDLIVDFEDAQGKTLQDTAKLPISVTPKGFFRAVFMDWWFLWLVAIVAAVLVYRKKTKPAKK